MIKLGVKISGTHERDFLIAQELQKLNMIKERDSVVQYNGSTRNILACFMHALESFDGTDVTHAVILQDDLQLCEGVLEIVKKCCEHFEGAVWSLFCSRITDSDKKTDSPYIKIKDCGMYGPAIIFPMKYLVDFKSWQKECVPEGFLHDDTVIGEYCKQNKIEVMSTIPSLLQHFGGRSSLLGHNCNVISKVWKGEKEPLKSDWENMDYNISKTINNSFASQIKKRGKNEND